jgi:hypothetical protein
MREGHGDGGDREDGRRLLGPLAEQVKAP